MKRAFHIVLFLLPLSVVMASFALPAHPGTLSPANIKASLSISNRTSWTPSALFSALGNTAEEKHPYFFDKAAFAFPVTDAAASLSPSVPATQSGDDVIYRRGPTTVESTLPPSPGPASAVKYADVPFTHSSGMAELDIPLYTLKGMELEIPISLSYRSGGIKLDEVAGVAGLGWELVAGGCITRTVVDMPDEFSSGVFSHQMPSGTLLSDLEDMTSNNSTLLYLRNLVWRYRDASLDRYSYSFHGLSGSFVILDDRSVFQLSGDGVVITPQFASSGTSLTEITSFTVTGPDGTVYVFSDTETGTHIGSSESSFDIMNWQPDQWEATTAWHLTSVTSPSGRETATLSYISGGTWEKNVYTVASTASFTETAGDEQSSVGTAPSYIASSYSTRVLSSVSLAGFTAAFAYADGTGNNLHTVQSTWESRQNFPRRLTSVSVSRGNATLMSVQVGTAKHTTDGRIVLASLSFRGSDGQTVTDRWNFTYRTRPGTVSRMSQDFYGYFNAEADTFGPGHGQHAETKSTLGPFDMVTAAGVPYISPSPVRGLPYKPRPTSPEPWMTVADYMSLASADHDGAVTSFTYERAECPAGGDTLSVGIRVREITVADNGTDDVIRRRRFTYSSPAPDGPALPLPGMYTTVSASQGFADPGFPGGILSSVYTWAFALHEYPVTVGPSLQDTRIHYGSVTEDVSSGDGTPGARTVYTYGTQQSYRYPTSVSGRFPSATWGSVYNSSSYAPPTMSPWLGIRDEYRESGTVSPPLLTRKDEYAAVSPAGGGIVTYSLVRSEENTYSAPTKRSVLVDYRAEKVMERYTAGDLRVTDIMHFPVYAHDMPGHTPESTVTVGYHPEGNDTLTVHRTFLSRGDLSKPVRVSSVSVTEGDVARSVAHVYPDQATSSPPVGAELLSAAHRIDSPVRSTWSVAGPASEGGSLRQGPSPLSVSPGDPVRPGYLTALRTVEREFGEFLFHGQGGSPVTVVLPSAVVEYTGDASGTMRESWREDVLSRDVLGNVSSVKAKGSPVTSFLWSYGGLHPVAVAENATASQLREALGGSSAVNSLAWAASPSASQLSSVSALRDAASMSSAHVTTFTFSPGVGLTSETSPSGVKAGYSYDTAGRLVSVTDGNGSLVSAYVYSLLNPGNGRLSVRSRTFLDSSGSSYSEDVSWFNTLGMRTQDIAVGASGTGDAPMDLVTAYEGDMDLHDDVKVWVPYPASGTAGSFRDGAAQASASYHSDTLAFSFTHYEKSPEGRVTATAEPGYAGLHGTSLSLHSAHMGTYGVTGADGFPALRWEEGTGVAVIGTYAEGVVIEERTVDPDGRRVSVFRDHAGRTLATSRGNAAYPSTDDPPTYYVYDALDRLRAVSGSGIPLSDTLSMWRYSYDSLGRLSSKGVPGSVREYYTYDSDDRVITVTRGDECTETGYDVFGRVTAKYITTGSCPRTLIESHEYDSYSSAASTLIGGGSYTSGPKKGLETRSSLAVTDGQGGFSGTASTAYAYDDLGRLSRSVTLYPDGHRNTTVISYDFAGNPTSTVVTGLRPGGGTTDVLSVTTEYDTRERPTGTISVLTVGGVEKARSTTAYSYDALGRLSAVSSGPTSAAGLLVSQYAYTLQQWMSSITTSLGGRTLFSETLGYDSPANTLGGPSYTGLITRKGETWTIPTGQSPSQFQSVSRTEDYVYDHAARLSAWDDSSGGEDISYDARGNIILRVPRHGSGGTVTMTYTGDRLATRKVGTAAAVSFAHDSFARMTTDAGAGLSIAYNAFDLPEQISQGTALKAKYTFLADGMKVSTLDASGAGLVYRGPFTYKRSSGGTLTFESAPFDRGRLTEAGARYHVTDHLGSVRAVISGNASTTTFPLDGFYSVDDYAPYGTKSTSSASSYLSLASTGTTVSLRDGFTGKEEQGPDFGAGYVDFGARQYSPILSRWLVPDPMGEKYYGISPYAYCAGNPVNMVDPMGLEVFPKGIQELEVIKNTLPKNARQFVQLNEKGLIDLNILSLYSGSSENYQSLLRMVQDEAIVVFSFSNEFTYLDQNGQKGTASLSYYPEDPFLKDTSVEIVSGLTTGESGNYGKTLFPDFDGEQNSTTNHIEIYLHSSLSTVGAAEAFSHEGYGHVLLYILSGYDHETASHQPRGMEDHNLRLVEMILSARRETINNINQ